MPAHYEVVDSLALPARLSGHAALDFCNTLAGWDGRATKDYLTSYDHLAVWSGFVGLLSTARVASLRNQASRQAKAAAGVLEHAREVRASLYDVSGGDRASRSFDRFAAEAQAAAPRLRLHRAGETVEWRLEPEAGLAAPLLAVAWSAGELLTSPDVHRIRVCPGVGCGWLFLDRSGRRRWCTMSICGNREKARRFASRQRDSVRWK